MTMKFKANTGREGSGDWIYRTRETGKSVEVRISYSKGSYVGRQRGITISVNDVEIGEAYPGANFESYTYDLFAGLYMHVSTLPRKNDKLTQIAAAWFSDRLETITTTWETEGKDSTKQLLSGLISDFNAGNVTKTPQCNENSPKEANYAV